MKTKNEFFEDFFARLTEGGFRVLPLTGGDLAAEVFASETLFCVITTDGEIIFEVYDTDKARLLEDCAEESRVALHCATQPPFADMERMDTVILTAGPYVKVFESACAVLLCRKTGMFGYEFITCQKAAAKHNSRRYYREQVYYDPAAAQDSFMERSGLNLRSPLSFSHEDLKVLVSCCARAVCLDNELDSGTVSRINSLMAKMEDYLPPQQELSPRHFFQCDIMKELEEHQ
ncbi:MAG: hypothetical protein RSA20_08245 [Oscillospiraceae bacterium]